MVMTDLIDFSLMPIFGFIDLFHFNRYGYITSKFAHHILMISEAVPIEYASIRISDYITTAHSMNTRCVGST